MFEFMDEYYEVRYEINRLKNQERVSKYRRLNPEKVKATNAKWNKENRAEYTRNYKRKQS